MKTCGFIKAFGFVRTSGFAKTFGFTLIELIVVMMIIGIVAVTAIPRLADTKAFDALGFHDKTLAALRYAQKSAIAQRRNVCVAFTSGSVTLTIASASGDASPCNTNLAGPNGSNPFTVTAASGVSFSATPANFNFTALGKASASRTLTVAGMPSITVEQETGYVH